MSERDLIERLRKRAEAEREIQRNNEAVAEALSGQLEAFHRRDGSHNNFAVRLGLDHRSCAKKDASLAADWEEAAATIARLSEALAEAEKKGAEDWQPIETAPDDARVFLGWDGYGMWPCMKLEGSAVVAVGQGRLAIMKGEDATHWRPLPAPPRDLSQGGQHG